MEYHEHDFKISCEWNFFATAHGKNACDAIGATLKRDADIVSTQNTLDKPIIDAQSFANYFREKVDSKVSVTFNASEDIIKTEDFISKRCENSSTIPGTGDFHYFKPLRNNMIMAKSHSYATEFTIKSMK